MNTPAFLNRPCRRLIFCCATVLFGSVALAAANPAKEASTPKQTKEEPRWSVRVEVLMVAMPQEKALPLLPDLSDPAKIDAAVTQILNAIGRKEATLTGYPVVQTLDGERSVSETALEEKYPTEYEPPGQPGLVNNAPARDSGTEISTYPMPLAFEVRNVGATLEVEPTGSANGDWISLKVVPQRVELLGFDTYEGGKTDNGAVMKVEQPKFFTTKVTTSLKIRNGQRCLIGVHKLVQPENNIEFFIIRAIAIPIK